MNPQERSAAVTQQIADQAPVRARRDIDVTGVANLIRKALREAFPGFRFSVRASRYSMGGSVVVSWTDGPSSALVQSITGRFQGISFDGSDDSTSYADLMLDGQPVRMASYVRTSRSLSDAMSAKADAMAARLGRDAFEVARKISDRIGARHSKTAASVQVVEASRLFKTEATDAMGYSIEALIAANSADDARQLAADAAKAAGFVPVRVLVLRISEAQAAAELAQARAEREQAAVIGKAWKANRYAGALN